MPHQFECRRCGTTIHWAIDDRTGKFYPSEPTHGDPRHTCQIDIAYTRARHRREQQQIANNHCRNLEQETQ